MEDPLVADAGMMRLLAHPLRMRIVGSLRVDGPATSAILARRLETDTGQTSHHLRLLARHGLVEEAPEHGKGTHGRERWWKAVHDSTLWSDLGVGGAEAQAAVQRTARAVWDRTIDAFFAQVAAQKWSEDWQRAAASSDYVLRTTPERLESLNAEIERLIREADIGDSTAADAASDAETVIVVLHSYPHRPPG
ncbi:helix-turn-helix domain-containing protein [Paractinoplanes rhizophilus]|uniref:Helix-turn-helix domain-containing protein n=1 Tax=Paractinoplanes rhizophilus TaxID=1416877 RepID=A0ABW2I1L8_9ACTN